METIQAVKCASCGALKEPKNLLVVSKIQIALGNPLEENRRTQKMFVQDIVYCDVDCLIRSIKLNVDDEIPF